MRTRQGWVAAVAACAVLAAAGCSSNDVIADPTSPTGTTASASSPTSGSSSALSSVPPATSSRSPVTTTPSASTSTSGATATATLPAGLAPAQVADAKAAVAAYVGYYRLVDRAYADPARIGRRMPRNGRPTQ